MITSRLTLDMTATVEIPCKIPNHMPEIDTFLN